MPIHIPAEALFMACAIGDAAAVSRLVPAGGSELNLCGPNFQHPYHKSTPLSLAAQGGHIEIVRMILERAPNTAVDYTVAIGYTALFVAGQYHHADIVRLLAEHGASLNVAAGTRVATPLRCAVGQMPPEAPPRLPDPGGARQVATVRALLRLGAGTPPPPPSPAPPHPLYPF